MALPVRKKLPHAVPQWVAEGSWFFITINCVPAGINQLCQVESKMDPGGAHGVTRPTEAGQGVLVAMKYNHDHYIWHCRLCLLMPDHLHAILAFPREPGMHTLISNWKRFVAGKCDVKWQRDFFDHRLRDHHEVDETTSYILLNPIRKGLCERIEDWPWVYQPSDRPPPQLG